MFEKIREHGLGFLASLRKTELKGIPIQELRAGEIIVIRTKNSKYALIVLNPEEQKVAIMKIKGKGKYFQKLTVTRVQGSCLELTSGNIVLTATQSVFVNGVRK